MKSETFETRVSDVSVYSDRARVTRTGTGHCEKGRQQIILEDLPDGLDDASVSVELQGARLLSVQVDRVFGKRNSNANAQELIARYEQMQRELSAIDDKLGRLSNEESFLCSISIEPQQNEEGVEQPIALSPPKWKGTLDFVTRSLIDVRKRIAEANQQREEKGRELQATDIEINKVRSYESQARKQVIIETQVAEAGQITARVTYAIGGPSWRPSYDVRVSSEGKVEIVTYAVVRQSTGEDWNGIQLGFSTAAPHVGAELPELLVWKLGDQDQYQQVAAATEVGAAGAGLANGAPGGPQREMAKKEAKKGRRSRRRDEAPPAPKSAPAPAASMAPPAPPAGRAASADMMRDMDDEIAMGGESIVPEPMPEEDFRRQEVERAVVHQTIVIERVWEGVWSLPAGAKLNFSNHGSGFTWSGSTLFCPSPQHAAGGFDYTYESDSAEDIPSDGRERRVQLATLRLDADLMYEVVAPLAQKAWLRTTVTNDTDRPLLAGESFIFLDDDFIGRAFVDTVSSSEDLELSLGVDDDVKVDRKVEQKAVTKGLISKKDQTSYDVNVTVHSFKKRPVKVRVRDQVPITWQKDDISIENVHVKPKPAEKPDRGMYEWVIPVEPGARQKVQLTYDVERPKDFQLIEERIRE